MAANTASAWTESRVGYASNSLYIASCTVLADTGNYAAYSLKTPRGLNVAKPWTLIAYFSADPVVTGTALLNLWGGYSDDFVMATTPGAAAITATSGGHIKELCDNTTTLLVTLPWICQITPNSFNSEGAVADVVTVAAIASGPKVRVPLMPYYAVGIDVAANVLDAVTAYYKIIQAKD